ncbi:hypothetical protein ACO0LV_03010 [Pseudactinotalea sp. Z1739]|uniref:hypothetical protein n=1 Tax=Pseudactinotalea sp. Z1739 TaxID=3413028 RepID=UPI003C7D66AE
MSGRHVDSPEPAGGAGEAAHSGAGTSGRTAAHSGTAGAGTGGTTAGRRVQKPGRGRVLLIVVIVALVVVAAIVTVLLIQNQRQSQAEPEVPDPVTTTLPTPTPAGDPMEVSEDSQLVQALPTTVLDHVLTELAADQDAFAEHEALEGWFLTYSAPGSDIEVHVLQWESADEAAAHAEDVASGPEGLSDGEGRRSGDVAVQGESVGRYEIGVLAGEQQPAEPSTPAEDDSEPLATPEPLGPGMAVWRNGTVVFVATGDAGRLAQFYDNYPF